MNAADNGSEETASYDEWEADPRLSPFITHLWRLEGDGPRLPSPACILPDANVELTLTLSGPLELRQNGAFERQPPRIVLGSVGKAIDIRYPARALTIGIRFHPALGAACFGRTGRSLHDKIVLLSALAPDLDREIVAWERAHAKAQQWRVELEEALLRHLARTRPPTDAIVLAAISNLDREEPPSIQEVADQLKISGRQLGRRFTAAVGIAPARFVRVRRFARAWRAAMFAPPEVWADLAADHGFADQAHMVREFHEFGARAPTRMLPDGWHDEVVVTARGARG